jgi:hypothetical protein
VAAVCGFEPSIIGATCGILDGTIYLFEGNKLGAGISFASVLPLAAGTAGDVAKFGMRMAAAMKSSLLGARSVPELLSLTNKYKVVQASSNTVHVLAGTADDAKAVFEAQTMGWGVARTIPDERGVLKTITSPDGTYSLTLRDFNTEAAMPPFKQINGTIDVLEYTVYSNGISKPKGELIEIKFAK